MADTKASQESVIDLMTLSAAPIDPASSVNCDTRSEQDGKPHAAHVFIIAKTEKKLFDRIPMKGFVLMQLRFDGLLGFPGGLVDSGESVCEGLNRELREEIGVKKDLCSEDDFFFSSHGENRNIHHHFYTKLVSETELAEIELNALSARERGLEVLGLIRVPLFIYDKKRGLPAFLTQNFIGDAREQLLLGLHKYKFIDIDSSGQKITLPRP